MLTEKEKAVVLLALLKTANEYSEEWEETKDDFCKDAVFTILKIARKFDSGSQYTYDIGALAAKMNQ